MIVLVVGATQKQPTDLQAVAVSPTAIRLTWDHSPLARAGYHIYYANTDTDPYPNVKVIAVPAQTEYTLSYLRPDTVYDIWVRAATEDNVSRVTPTVRVKTGELGECNVRHGALCVYVCRQPD